MMVKSALRLIHCVRGYEIDEDKRYQQAGKKTLQSDNKRSDVWIQIPAHWFVLNDR
jgi:hypothetical protein